MHKMCTRMILSTERQIHRCHKDPAPQTELEETSGATLVSAQEHVG